MSRIFFVNTSNPLEASYYTGLALAPVEPVLETLTDIVTPSYDNISIINALNASNAVSIMDAVAASIDNVDTQLLPILG